MTYEPVEFGDGWGMFAGDERTPTPIPIGYASHNTDPAPPAPATTSGVLRLSRPGAFLLGWIILLAGFLLGYLFRYARL